MASRSHAILWLEPEAGLTFPRVSPSCGLSADECREPANVRRLFLGEQLAAEAEAKDGLQELELHPKPHHVLMAVVGVHVGELDVLEELQGDVRHLLAEVVAIHLREVPFVLHQLVNQFVGVLVNP